MKLQWLLKMAWRDSRKNRSRLFLFMSSIILGIAALVAINSFGDNLKRQVNEEAKSLLSADLEIESKQPFPDSLKQFLDSLNLQTTEEINFASMVLFPKNGGARLVNIRAVESEFPYYGKLLTNPSNATNVYSTGQMALVDKTLLTQFNASPGDEIKIGTQIFKIAGSILKVPGQSGITSSVAPPVFIPLNLVESTNLLQKGSRISYSMYVKYPEGFKNSVFEEVIKPRLEKDDLRFEDVDGRKQQVGNAYADLTGFLNLTAFIALLLGCIGVASSVHIYMKEKVQSVAILRCLGAKGSDGVGIFLMQIFFMGFLGSVLGAFLGTMIQYFLPVLFADFLPFELNLELSWASIFMGVGMGIITSILFALFPLLNIRRVSPLKALRLSYESNEPDRLPYLVYVLIVLFITGFTYMQLGSINKTLIFSAVLYVSFGLLAGFAKLITWLTRKYLPVKSSFTWRQGLSNLYRPNNQTLILVITIGLGTSLIMTLLLSQQLLLDKLKFSSAADSRPNMVVFDIQESQKDSINQATLNNNMPVIASVPIITMRIENIDGRTIDELKDDTTSKVQEWVLDREYRVTYRDTLIDSEELIEGNWDGTIENAEDTIFVSLDKRLAEDMNVRVGDPVTFNVQGAIIKTYVGSIRKIDFQRVQTNFLVLFPNGVLEKAPKFYVLLTRFTDTKQSADFQQLLVTNFPNVSIIDLNLILETVDGVIKKVSFIIRFMAFFSIITGILVLIGSVMISKFQRIQESVLLRTMGASRKQIFNINALEYFLLGSLSALTGILISVGVSMALAKFSFNTILVPDWIPMLIGYVAITSLTVIIGLLNSRDVVNKPPLEILRKEV
ncbi:MAG: FtsX-like permease family protein [Bacteroidetes bacterium]|nr:FtsX-like permease family protein [Bacteroidota bacterium]